MSQLSRPLYSRLLRLSHLRLRGPVAFALFEGSICVAALLVLAEIVSGWGMVAIPVAVALMVKLNDIVAGSFAPPLAFAPVSIPQFAGGVIVGRSPVPRPSQLTVEIGGDDAVADAAPLDSPLAARGRASSIARGVAVVPVQDDSGQRRPSPDAQEPEPPLDGANADSADIGTGTIPPRTDPTGRRNRGNQGRFTS